MRQVKFLNISQTNKLWGGPEYYQRHMQICRDICKFIGHLFAEYFSQFSGTKYA